MNKPLRIDEYVRVARSTALYPKASSFIYPVLGLAGEFGEFVDEAFQGHGLKITTPKRRLVSEMGDVLWYVVNTALDLGLEFQDLVDLSTGGLRADTFEELCFCRLKPRDKRSPYLKITIAIGQLSEVAKKSLRDGYTIAEMSATKRAVCVSALHAILVSLCEICEKQRFCLSEVALDNNLKLTSRKERGKLKGDGNDR